MTAESHARVHLPVQGRSQETFERIVIAARKLLDGRDYESISVQEICTRAKVSASSFYARFENKEALLLHIHESHRRDRAEKFARYVTDVDWDRLSSCESVKACLELYVQSRRELEPFLRSLMLAELRFPEIASERARVDSLGIDIVRGRLLASIHSDAPDLVRRIEFGIRVVCTAAQEAIRPPSKFASQIGMTDAKLVDELTIVFCSYVGIPLGDDALGEESPGSSVASQD